MIKEATKTVYTTTDGTEFTDRDKAVEYEKSYLEIRGIMRSLIRVKHICEDCDDCVKCPLKRFFPDYADIQTDDCPFGDMSYPCDEWGYIDI